MNKKELIALFGDEVQFQRLEKAGLPMQLLLEPDVDFLRRIVAWMRARATYRQYLEAQANGDQEGSRAAVADHLHGYLSGDLPAINKEIATALLIALKQASGGEVATLLTPRARKRGERVESVALQACIADAGTYIVFCLAHASERWVDHHPVKTVAALYSVDARTASRWKERVSDVKKATLSEQPAQSEPRTHAFRMIRGLMRSSAVQYARFGGQAVAAQWKRSRARDGAK